MSRLYRPNLTRHRQRPIVILRPQPQPQPEPKPQPPPNLIEIFIKDIATEMPQGSNIWFINNDLTINADQNCGVAEGQTVITAYDFTNNGYFGNGGVFCFINKSKNFVNNGKFDNTRSNSVNFGTFIVNGKPIDIIKNMGGNIVNFGTNYDGRIWGNQVLNLTTPIPPH